MRDRNSKQQFLYAIGKKRSQAMKSHYKANGLEQRKHGNKRSSPHNYSYVVLKFLINYAEENMQYCFLDVFLAINAMTSSCSHQVAVRRQFGGYTRLENKWVTFAGHASRMGLCS
ncbi:uncharacterized protein [Dysidea avara]|uniref:uncharacterized protein n=1 Tax=Dysidea avara TaxID=196820 RepID=UPI003318AAE8